MTKLIDINELSELTGISVSTLYSWVSQKRIPHIKIGRMVRFRMDEIDRWLSSQEVPAREWAERGTRHGY